MIPKAAAAFVFGLALAGVAGSAWAQGSHNALGITLCSGADGGMYQKAVQEVLKQGKGRLDIKAIETKGSIDNLEKLAAAECDAAPVQNDAFRVFREKYSKDAGKLEKAGPLYLEYVHFLCNNRANIGRITDLRSNKYAVAIGPARSGSSVTWDSFVLADKKGYGGVPTIPLDGVRALEKVKMGDEATCMIFTAALNNSFMKTNGNEAGDRVSLTPADDGDFNNAKDEKNQSIYRFVAIPGGTYPKIQHGTFGSSVSTVGVDAIWVVRTDWIEDHEKAYNYFLEAKNKASASIKQLVGQ